MRLLINIITHGVNIDWTLLAITVTQALLSDLLSIDSFLHLSNLLSVDRHSAFGWSAMLPKPVTEHPILRLDSYCC